LSSAKQVSAKRGSAHRAFLLARNIYGALEAGRPRGCVG